MRSYYIVKPFSPTELTARIQAALRVLSLNAGRIVTHESLLHQVRGDKRENGRHVVRTYVKRVRQKLGDNPSQPTYIFTRVRVGYHMPEPSEPSAPPSAPEPPGTADADSE